MTRILRASNALNASLSKPYFIVSKLHVITSFRSLQIFFFSVFLRIRMNSNSKSKFALRVVKDFLVNNPVFNKVVQCFTTFTLKQPFKLLLYYWNVIKLLYSNVFLIVKIY